MLLRWTGANRDDETADAVAVSPEDERRGGGDAWKLWLVAATAGWIVAALAYLAYSAGLSSLLFLLPHEQAQVLIALLLPPALIWLVVLVLRRGTETERSRAALMEVLSDVAGPDREAEARLNATANSLRRISQTVEAELGNALARAETLNRKIDSGLQQMNTLAEGAGQRSVEATELLQKAGGEQQRVLEDLARLSERVRTLGRAEASELGSAVESASRRAEEIAAAMDAKARAATETVEAMARRAQELGAAIDQPMTRMREESEQTLRRLNAASQELRQRVDGLGQAMARTVEQAGEASAGVDGSSARLRQTATEMRGLLSGSGEEIRQRIQQLQELVVGAVRASDQASQRLDQRLGQFSASVDGLNVSAGEAEEALGAAMDRMQGVTGKVEDGVRALGEAAGEAADRAEGAAASVMQSSASFGAAARQIDQAGERLGTSRDELSSTVAHLSGLVEETMSGLEERIREVSTFAESTTERSGMKLTSVAQGVALAATGLEKQLTVLEKRAREAEAQGAGSADMLALRVGELKGVLTEIGQATAESGTGLSALADKSGDLLLSLDQNMARLNQAIGAGGEAAAQATDAVTGAMSALRRDATETEARLARLGEASAARAEGLEAVSRRIAGAAQLMQAESAERLEAVAASLSEIDATTRGRFDALRGSLVGLFDDLQTRSDAMTEAVDGAGERTAAAGQNLNEAMAELSLLLQDIDRSVGGAGVQIADLDDRVKGVAAAIRGGVEDNLNLMEARSQAATGRLFETVNALSEAADDLDRRSGAAEGQLVTRQRAVIAEIASAEDRIGGLIDAWQGRSDRMEGLRAALSDAAAELDGETAAQLDRVTSRLSDTVSETRNAVTALETERSRLAEIGSQTGTLVAGAAADAEMRLGAAADRAEQMVASVASQMDLLEAHARKLEEGTSAAGINAEEGGRRMADLVDRLQGLSNGLMGQITEMSTTAEAAAAGLVTTQGDFSSSTTEMMDRLTVTATALSGETTRISTLLQGMQADADSADQKLSARMHGLEQSVRDASDLAQLTADTLLAGAEAMVGESRRSRDEVEAAMTTMQARLAEISTLGEATGVRIAGAASELEMQLTALRAAGAEADDVAEARAERVAARMRELTAASEAARESWDAATQSIALSAESSEARSRAAIASMNAVSLTLEQALPSATALEASAEAALEKGRQLGRDMAELETGLGGAVSRMGELRSGFEAENRRVVAELSSGIERVGSGAEEARARLDAFVAAERDAATLFERLSDQVKSQVGEGVALVERMRETGGEADQLLTRKIAALSSAEQRAADAAGALAARLQAEEERLTAMRASADGDADRFAERIAGVLTDLRSQATAFSSEIAHLNEASDALGVRMAETTERMGKDALTFAETGGEIRRISDLAMERLGVQRTEFAAALDDADKATDKARKALGEQATAIASASQAVTMQSGLATRAFEGQAIRLEKAAHLAADSAAQLKETSRTEGDRRFLTSAAHVAEGLNSLALDLHRLLDPDATEGGLDRYMGGDKGLFARRLLGREQRRKIAAAYRSDGDFRRYADQYIQEFEGVMRAALKADHQGILKGVFVSADVGKLYLALCDALERTPVGAGGNGR